MSHKTKAAEFIDETYNITIAGRNLDVTDALRDYVYEKIAKIERFSKRIIDVVVTIDTQKLDQRVDIVLKVDNTKIKSQATTENMYASIDKAVDKLEVQLKKYKDKIHHHQGKRPNDVMMNVNVLRTFDQELADINDDIEVENRQRIIDKYRPHKIVDKETRALKTLADGEALLKMELSGDAFLVYRSEENHDIKVIYRRNDGNFGVIDTKTDA